MIWVRETARVDQSSAEEPVVLVTCEDITEHKRTEHESRERIRQATAMQAALLELAHLDDTRQTFSEALPQVTSIVADMLAVERVSLWLLSEDRTELVCQDLYLRRQATHSAGNRLPVSRYPRYCAVLMESLVIAAPNARVDQRTSEFDDDYFPSLGITSVLDVPIRRQGKIVGVLWSEHVGFPREWSHEAQDFAASVGQTIARMMEVAERKQAEEALRKKSQELDRYFTSALDLLCIADVTGHFKRLNKAWQSTLGYPLEELEGAKFLDYVHPDDLEATLHALGDLTEEKEVLSFVNRYRRKDGSYRWIEWKSIPAGELIYAAARDITERKRMEDALRARERISQDLHDGILQSLFGVGLNLEVTKSLMSQKIRKTAGGSLDKSIDQLNCVMREIRNFIAGLGPDPIEGKDLSTALQSMLTSLTENQPTRVRLAVEKRAVQAVSAEQSIHLFRVIQEAVSNCIRHGFAQEARVSLKMLKQGVRLSIRDNGRGFNQDIVKAGGYGLRNMAARAQKISGRFTVLSKENEGTRIILDLPKEASNVSR
jgi:PAS domain S-box-containing protein